MLPPDCLVQFPGTEKGVMPRESLSEGQQGGLPPRNQLRRWFQSRRVISRHIVDVMRGQSLGILHEEPVGVGDILTTHPGPQPGIPAGGWRGGVRQLPPPGRRVDPSRPGHVGA